MQTIEEQENAVYHYNYVSIPMQCCTGLRHSGSIYVRNQNVSLPDKNYNHLYLYDEKNLTPSPPKSLVYLYWYFMIWTLSELAFERWLKQR